MSHFTARNGARGRGDSIVANQRLSLAQPALTADAILLRPGSAVSNHPARPNMENE